MRVAMVSEHVSPLAVLDNVDAGGRGVTVYTRRDGPHLPERVYERTTGSTVSPSAAETS